MKITNRGHTLVAALLSGLGGSTIGLVATLVARPAPTEPPAPALAAVAGWNAGTPLFVTNLLGLESVWATRLATALHCSEAEIRMQPPRALDDAFEEVWQQTLAELAPRIPAEAGPTAVREGLTQWFKSAPVVDPANPGSQISLGEFFNKYPGHEMYKSICRSIHDAVVQGRDPFVDQTVQARIGDYDHRRQVIAQACSQALLEWYRSRPRTWPYGSR